MKPDNCPLCAKPLAEPKVRYCALSRVMRDDYICNECGNREAMLDDRASRVVDRRICLYADEASGIMLVVEDEPGYEPFGRKPVSMDYAREYCLAWNRGTGVEQEVDEILASSMFGRWAHF